MSSLIGIVLFVAALLVAILLHEAGHFSTAKLFGMRVERFFVGFGKTVWSTRRGETEYGVKVFPLGGFCKIAGMTPHEDDGNFLESERRPAGAPRPEPTPPERQFRNKPRWQRAVVLVAGSVTHFLVALLLIYGLLVVIGVESGPPTTTIDSTVASTEDGEPAPAVPAGLRPGDRIVALDGDPIQSWEDLRESLEAKPGEQVTIAYERDGQRHTTTLVLASERGPDGERRGFLGVSPVLQVERLGPLAGVPAAAEGLGRSAVLSVQGLGNLVTGLADRLEAPEPQPGGGGGGGGEGPVGIVGIGRLAGQAVDAGAWRPFLLMLIQFNVFIGIFNLLPIPILDGGHLAFLGWETVTRRQVDLRKVAPLAVVALCLLVALSVVVLWLDITNPIANPFR